MLTVTPIACSRLSELLSGRPENIAVRIVRRKGHLKLRRGTQRPGDEVIEHDGRTVLLLDENMAAHLENRTLDVRNTEDGPKLRFRRMRDKRKS